MIAFIRGKVIAYGLDYVILENNGIGWRIHYMHPETLSLNQNTIVYTYQHVREDEISLFGFVSMEEYDLFVNLIQVKGLGPKTALNILSAVSVGDLINMIENNDLPSLKRLPGIGSKTASQMILDLKGKLVHDDKKEENQPSTEELNDALMALKALGYRQSEINAISKELAQSNAKTNEEYVRIGLQLLLKRKGG